MQNRIKQPLIWSPPELINHFATIKDHAYTEMQIDEFIKLFNRYEQSSATEIITLLQATQDFYSGTTLGHFKKVRDETKTNNDLMAILNNMSLAFQNANKQYAAKPTGSIVTQALSDALTFCTACVIHRLEELNHARDKIYTLYMNENEQNSLKTILQKDRNKMSPK